ncbi:hypothetical protein YK48G_25110 [Lentilactobacillus fungorum]|uniref:Uncharacterized protein n=1 Tax=Lentilactobacillus fungorum TaxID=2201250 RepID=A0ABQ3W4P9_9LACO|nr:hypothetical protein YK48G_25110 [Lentilactobacillus fungorum]
MPEIPGFGISGKGAYAQIAAWRSTFLLGRLETEIPGPGIFVRGAYAEVSA